MPLRTARALRLFWRTLLDIKEGTRIIMTQIDDLKAADTAEASAVSTALAAILALQVQHQEDLVKLAGIAGPADDGTELAALTASMQARAKSITDALSTLHDTVKAPAEPTAAAPDAPAPVADPAPAPAVDPAAPTT